MIDQLKNIVVQVLNDENIDVSEKIDALSLWIIETEQYIKLMKDKEGKQFNNFTNYLKWLNKHLKEYKEG